ncbi:PIN2/TERF1-interacting telomerase inhibitor 1 isoform X1 [Rhinatrema bivittatum]|uniref:PIN2/TERF1-interacting telomerase inhibitor 1 isoform X1 n=1 Tax=Rhinatrema bivittatum TaxID=194408 RepID=UPI001127CB97|nr:PIN2/TERF1-interacting telomerase inhibitor 1 isoform X1 [Rhinatrema bivittatum]
MAMLAEPRRKQKWSLDPRNSAWSKDESKFGQKMLEKMGWSKGKGLGAQEQGSTEHIKVQVKNNNLGLGATNNHEDNWIAHQDDFNQILAELNDCHGQSKTEISENQQKKTFSLEEKSKSSRKRVHYMKFAKGKDLSSRSETDLACIFGKRQKKSKKTFEEDTSADSTEEIERETRNVPNNAESAVSDTTVTSSLSMKEYFAKRMAELKKSQDNTKVQNNLAGTSSDEVEENPRDFGELKSKSNKKKKHRKGKRHSEDAPIATSMKYGSESEDLLTKPHLESLTDQKKKKKLKGKGKTSENGSEGGSGSFPEGSAIHMEASEEEACHEKDSVKNQKKQEMKKKRKREAIQCNEDHGDGYCPSAEGRKKKKKKQHFN